MNANPSEIAFQWRYAFIGSVLLVSVALVSLSFHWWSIETDRGLQTSLPPDLPSQQAEALYEAAFSRDLMSNSLFVVLRRTGRSGGLRPDDREFIENVLQPALSSVSVYDQWGKRTRIVKNVRTARNKYIGSLLDSEDGKATLVAVELKEDLTDQQVLQAVDQIERLTAQHGPLAASPHSLFRAGVVPPGLSMEMSGMASFTRDINRANKASARAIEMWSLLALGLLLIVTQKSPVLVVIPLGVVFLSVHAALGFLTFTTERGWLTLYSDFRCYAAVVCYCVAAEQCLWLLSGYRTQVERQSRTADAFPQFPWRQIRPVLIGAIATVAVTSTLLFADFGRFHQIGAVLIVGLVITWGMSSLLTFGVIGTLQHWIFWPHRSQARISARKSWLRSRQTESTLRRAEPEGPSDRSSRFGLPLSCALAIGLLLPFAIVAVHNADRTTYRLLNVLPIHAPSVIGADAVQRHFPPGAISPATILLEDQTVQFNSVEGKQLVADLTECVASASETHGILDVRSLAYPLGLQEERKIQETVPFRIIRHRAAVSHYVADQGRWNGHVTKLDLIVDQSPFSRSGFHEFEQLQELIHACLPPELSKSRVYFLGATARIVDLHSVNQHDQLVIQLASIVIAIGLSLAAVKRLSVACVLVCSGLLCWLATMGVCDFILSDVLAGGPYELDWQVVTLSFTIVFALVFPGNLAVVRQVLTRASQAPTNESNAVVLGGLAMLACSLSLFASDVLGLQQLGLAIAVGMVLTTVLVRPFFIPGWMHLLSNDEETSHTPSPERTLSESRSEFAHRELRD